MDKKVIFFFLMWILIGCSTIVKKKEDSKIKPKIDSYSYQPKIKETVKDKLDEDTGDFITKKSEKNNKENNDIKKNERINNSKNNKSDKIANNKKYKDNDKEKSKIINDNDLKYEQYVLENYENMKLKENVQKDIEVKENQKFYISLKLHGWILKSINPGLIKLINRTTTDKNTVFQFKAGPSGNIEIIFLRYDDESMILTRQTYKVNVIPEKMFIINEKDKIKENTIDLNEEKIFDDNSDIVMAKNETMNDNNKKEKDKKKKNVEEEDYRKSIANEHFNQKNYDEAKKIYLSLINEGKQDPEILYKMGIIEKIKGNLDKSNEYFIAVLNEKGKDNLYYSDALMELIDNLKSKKEYLKAIDIFYKYGLKKDMDKNKAEALNLLLADLYFDMSDYNNSSNEYRRFLVRYPNAKDIDKALFFLAYSIENLKNNPDFEEARRIYKIIIEDYPESKYYEPSKRRVLHIERHYLMIN